MASDPTLIDQQNQKRQVQKSLSQVRKTSAMVD